MRPDAQTVIQILHKTIAQILVRRFVRNELFLFLLPVAPILLVELVNFFLEVGDGVVDPLFFKLVDVADWPITFVPRLLSFRVVVTKVNL